MLREPTAANLQQNILKKRGVDAVVVHSHCDGWGLRAERHQSWNCVRQMMAVQAPRVGDTCAACRNWFSHV